MLSKKWVLTDHISRTTSQYLKSALCSHLKSQTPLTSTDVPKGYHFLYFNFKSEESDLSFDGYDSYQAPSNDFKRRMWVNGELSFLKDLKFNEQSFCVENVERVRNIKCANLVTISREILNGDGEISILEKRSLVYLNDLYDASKTPVKKFTKQSDHRYTLTPSDILLFRYSALTFNSHKIHYDKQYAKTEGYPNLIVHGPLTVTLMMEWVQSFNDEVISSFRYKNVCPLFVNQPLTLCLREDDENAKWDVWIENEQGHVAFEGVIEYIK
ncbi:hypothetical protein WICPIJ_004873 [Wickerhamomyces pijperi]|uniref:MaoC-like domain-containing protein n=1 Tax=Wickerhamomyces pijperi TaxID=599730 RepID=A0A9P8Q4W3_WICPI|nr:hypothetical protein WICPIJ_004873 [Wickerhamomyces pijperi]